jgi:hypothetical protein
MGMMLLGSQIISVVGVHAMLLLLLHGCCRWCCCCLVGL